MASESPFKMHCQRWKEGCGARECAGARKVFARGKIPCDVLFIGEAPGESEDVNGVPFIGPAGHLLDAIVKRAVAMTGADHLRVCFTNLVMCIPRDDDGAKSDDLGDDQIESCAPRLVDLVGLARPRMLVAVGRHSTDYTQPGTTWRIKFHRDYVERDVLHKYPGAGVRVCIKHPSAILRLNIAQRGLEVQRCIANLADALEFLCEHDEIKS
jgi:uracil-DNA glycosylase family 4